MPNGEDRNWWERELERGRKEREARLYPWGRQPPEPRTPPGEMPIPGAMSYAEFLALTPEEQREILGGFTQPSITLPEGWEWEQIFDPTTGSIWQPRQVGVAEEELEWPIEPMTEYQQEQMRLQREELEWRMGQASATGDMTTYQQAQLELQRLQLGLEERRLGAEEFGEVRDWIKRWKFMNPQLQPEAGKTRRWEAMTPEQRRATLMVGRFAGTGEKTGWQPDIVARKEAGYHIGGPEDYESEAKYHKAWADWDTAKAKEIKASQTLGELGYRPGEEYGVTSEGPYPVTTAMTGEGAVATHRALQRELEGRPARQVPSAPPTPEWMPQFVPGQVAGQTMERLPVKTPSGQQWGRTPWSVREGLAGYADWAGGRAYRDILEQMAMMQPRTPTRPRGWQPAVRR